MNSKNDFQISVLGEPRYTSPIKLSKTSGDHIFNFVENTDKILVDTSLTNYTNCINNNEHPECLEKAGPREKIFFDPKNTTAAIVSCGGLCPGINNVIRSLVMALHYFYGVKRIVGVPYGYEGLIDEYQHGLVDLVPDQVKDIHQFGGTILGSSRGSQSVEKMVDTLVANDINILFTIGGDGTLKGTNAIGDEIERRGLNISVMGIPKTIDNDINLIDKSFGFETSFDVSSPIIRDAHNEATGPITAFQL